MRQVIAVTSLADFTSTDLLSETGNALTPLTVLTLPAWPSIRVPFATGSVSVGGGRCRTEPPAYFFNKAPPVRIVPENQPPLVATHHDEVNSTWKSNPEQPHHSVQPYCARCLNINSRADPVSARDQNIVVFRGHGARTNDEELGPSWPQSPDFGSHGSQGVQHASIS